MIAQTYLPKDIPNPSNHIVAWANDLQISVGYMADCFRWMERTMVQEIYKDQKLPITIRKEFRWHLDSYEQADNFDGAIPDLYLHMIFDELQSADKYQLIKYYLEREAEVLMVHYHKLCLAAGYCEANTVLSE